MNSILEKIGKGFLVTIGAILLIVLILGIDWAVTVGIIYIICKCFSWHFTLLTATGVWLIISFIACVLKNIKRVGSDE